MSKGGKKVLIIEDEAQERAALTRKIEQAGFETIEAKNGIEGLESALKNHPDLVLLDIVLPKLNGIELAKQLRQDDWGKDVPIIILSNLSDQEETAEALEQDVLDFLVKSDSRLEDVIELIKRKIGSS
jgi:DNA-binding response OmpR family regulator